MYFIIFQVCVRYKPQADYRKFGFEKFTWNIA